MQTQARTHVRPFAVETPAVGTRLLDRYVLPKVAMALILVSAAAGVWLTLTGIGVATPDLAVAKWLGFLALSVVLGSSLWGAYFTSHRYAEQELDSPTSFLLLEYQGYAAIVRYAAIVALVAGVYGLARYAFLFAVVYTPWYGALELVLGALWVGLCGLALAVPGKLHLESPDGLRSVQNWLKLIAAVAALNLLAVAVLDVYPDAGADVVTIAVRWLHLLGVAAWFGGAVWNVFVAVPAARKTLSFATVFAAASQLEGFRRVVRVALPLVLVSGVYQSYRWIGLNPAGLLGLPVGVLILLKVTLIVSLVAIFIACPMWRACSPIAGVCDITDVETGDWGLGTGARE